MRFSSNPEGRAPQGRNPLEYLLQSGAALFAATRVHIISHIFFARRAAPVKSGKINKGKNNQYLREGKGVLREFPKQVGTFIQHGNQENENDRRYNCDELAGTAHNEILRDLLRVFSTHP
jgi:hypothetical protein